MVLIDLLLWMLLLGCLAGALLLLGFTWREELRTRALLLRYEGLFDGADGVGISLLLSEPRSCREVEELLSVEWARYEVVVVAEGVRQQALVEELCRNFDLVRVDYQPEPDLPTYGVEELYRSRQRAFRRLVLLTRSGGGVEEDWTAATGVASHEWLLPLRGGMRLRHRGVERLVAEVESRPPGSLQGVVSLDRVRLLSLEVVLRAEGFGRRLDRLWRPERLFLFARAPIVVFDSKTIRKGDLWGSMKKWVEKIFRFHK